MTLKILHIAVENFCGIPLELVRAHRRFGHVSNLVTYIPSGRGYDDDLCLDYPLVGSPRVEELKKIFKIGTWIREVKYGTQDEEVSPVSAPGSIIERSFLRFRDVLWKRKARKAINRWELFDYDIYHLEGGLGFLRSGEIVRELKARGKKIVTMYYGSDLRLRGIMPDVENVSDIDLTIEYDHLKLYPKLKFVFLPIDVTRFPRIDPGEREGPVRIGHSPTRRELKGTTSVIRAVEEVSKHHDVELVLIENLPYKQAIQLKATCQVFIDQVGSTGGTGYGVSSVESMTMGIPTISDLAPDLAEFLPDHPFILATPETLAKRMVPLVEDPNMRKLKGEEGRRWVEKNHHADRVAESMYALYREMGWMGDMNQQ